MPAVAVGNPQAEAAKAPAAAGTEPAATTAKAASSRAVGKGAHRAKSRSVTCKQGEVQWPRVTAADSELSRLASLPPGGPPYFTIDFFSAMKDLKGHWRQNTAALKWFRDICERGGLDEGFALSNEHVAAVAAMIHPAGPSYSFAEDDMREFSWHEMVAQLDRESLEKVVQDGDSNRGLVGCEFRPRRNSYDHARQVQPNAPQEQLPDWDFVLVRSDGSAVRLHPDWKKPNIQTFRVAGNEEPVELPKRGMGKSDGKGTFKKYRILGALEPLRFRTLGTFV